MSLRTRLIIAFLLLSVLPLSAVTFLSYTSSVRAFEQAAQREATQSAFDVSRRMEMVTADVGRRMDRLFAAGTRSRERPFNPDPRSVRENVAPLLGETAALVEQVEFRPEPGLPALPGAPAADGVPVPIPPVAPAPPGRVPDEGGPPGAGRRGPPPGSDVLVMDIPRIVEETRAAAAAGAQGRGAAREDAGGSALQGNRVEIAVQKEGRVIGRARARLNMDRTLRMVLGFARRDQGEISFAIDRAGRLHTLEAADRPRLQSLGVERTAPAAAGGTPRRVGDWIVVARRAPGGILFGIARPIGQSLRDLRRAAVRNLGLGMLVIALAFIGIVPISHRMTLHLAALTAGVRQLAAGDFRTRLPVRSRDEFGVLAAAFNQMAEDLERHEAGAVRQERLRRELELSRLIQTEMLPKEPLRAGPATVAGRSLPAREVGGDFFNYFLLPDGRLAVLIGDVSGKGVSAALLMANIQATLRARLPHETDLAALAASLDRELDRNTPRGVYLTLFVGILDTATGELRYVNAGHNPQILHRAAEAPVHLPATGMPIALYPGQDYAEGRAKLAPGDLLFCYTDGLVETETAGGDVFGMPRLEALLASEWRGDVPALLSSMERHVAGFRGDAEPADDATMMALTLV